MSPPEPSATADTDAGGRPSFEAEAVQLGRAGVRSRGRGTLQARRYRRLNDATAALLVLIVLVAPIPVASNRPALWMLWAAILGLVAALYLAASLLIDPDRGLRSRGHARLFWLAGLVPAFALVQILPIADYLPAILTTLPAIGTHDPESVSLIPSATILGAVRFISYIVFFALMLEVASRPSRAIWMAWALFFGVTAHALWAMVSLNVLGDDFFWGEKLAYRGTATGTFINRNSFATFLSMGLVLGVALLFGRGEPGRNRAPVRANPFSADAMEAVFLWLLIGLIVITLLATQSRMGLFAGAIGALFCLAIMIRKSGRVGGGSLLGVVTVAGGGVLALTLFLGQDLIERFIFVGSDGLTRGELYRQVVGMIGQRPWLGYGLDSFPVAFELFHRLPLSSDSVWDNAHSSYLALWAELGIVVGSIPVLLALMVGVRLVQIIRNREKDYALSVAALAALVTAAIHSLIDFSLEIQANVLLLLALTALGIARRRSARPNSEAT